MRSFVCVLACVASLAVAAPTIGVTFDQTTGKFNVTINSESYFYGLQPSFQENGVTVSPADGSLRLTGVKTSTGQDGFGAFTSTNAVWTSASKSVYQTQIRLYASAVVFGQTYVTGASNTAVTGDVLSSFPSFQAGGTPQPLGYLSYDGEMVGVVVNYGKWGQTPIAGGLFGSGPLVLFTEDLSLSFVLSSASNFMAASQAYDNATNVQSYGIMGSVTSVPAGFTVETILEVSSGVNNAMMQWGSHLLARYNKNRDYRARDLTLRYLGYSTDNGAYYYYHTEPNQTYEQTLLGVYEYAQQEGLPYKWILLDSWWYFKDPNGGGVVTWDAMPSVFPDGLDYFYNKTGWPIQGHNRYWSHLTTYAKQNGGQFDFIFNTGKDNFGIIGVPIQQEFWDYLLQTSKRWGLTTYEQDWLDDEFQHVSALREDAQLGRQWLLQMGRAADKNNMGIQYCMSMCRHVMQSLEIPAVTQARASTDYHPGGDQWILGISSMFAYAVGIAPTKDNYWSTPVQPGTGYGPNTKEPNSRLQAAVSTLTSGPVAPSDKIGYSNVALIMMSCMKDGLLLQHTRPATNIDATFLFRSGLGQGPDGEVQSAGTVIAGGLYSSLLVANLKQAYPVSTAVLGYGSGVSVVYQEANSTGVVTLLGPGGSIPTNPCGETDFQLYSIAPVLPNGWAVVGETAKWVPVNVNRFSNIAYDTASVTVTLRGVVGEPISVSFYNSASKNVVVVSCVFDEEETLVLSVPAATCVVP